ncbi:unnamed protein product [Phytomonas sp. EM1]|nr:unnamed protein product [Phytomonas sp. EM1]|eukprot:CCW61881.1 unnamed protein product [Phytomonas sp. isolate EM1]
MSVNPVVKVFLTQPIQNVSASTLSSLVYELKSDLLKLSTSGDTAANDGILHDVLQRLVSIANNGTKNTTIRSMVLECLYWISHHASDAVRQGPLFDSVLQLNESFEAMLEQEGDTLELQYLMLSVLLLRVSGYGRLKVGDLLEDLYRGDARRVVSLLLKLLEDPSYEWPLCEAAARWMFELTTPACYFAAETKTDRVIDVSVFQGKLSVVLEHGMTSGAFAAMFAGIVELWRRSWGENAVLGALSSCNTITGGSVFTSNQLTKLVQWATLLHFVSASIENLSAYCNRSQFVKSLQRSFFLESQAFLADVAIPFIMAAIQAWSHGVGSRTDDLGSCEHPKADPMLRAAIEVLQFLRFALYKAPATPPPSDALLHALKSLAQHVVQRESTLSRDDTGMAVILLAVELLCNINAKRQRALSNVFETLLRVIASDESPACYVVGLPFANIFIAHFTGETSSYVETQNESVELVHHMFSKRKEENDELGEAAIALEEQLDVVQEAIMQWTLGQALDEFMCMLSAQPLISGGDLIGTGTIKSYPVPEGTLSRHLPSGRRHDSRKPNRAKHPAKYCCQMTGKLMREPVTLRSGHHFEFDALNKVISEVGHVNPLTGEIIEEEVEVNEALQQEISAYCVKRAARLE